jgi:hypothetical protein
MKLELRAVYALRAMLSTALPPAEAVEILASTAAAHVFLPVQVAALSALSVMQNPFDEDPPCFAEPRWELDTPPELLGRLQYCIVQETAAGQEPSHTRHHLELLAHLDSAWTMWVLVRQRQTPGLESVVDGALKLEQGHWPVPKPKWLPLEGRWRALPRSVEPGRTRRGDFGAR